VRAEVSSNSSWSDPVGDAGMEGVDEVLIVELLTAVASLITPLGGGGCCGVSSKSVSVSAQVCICSFVGVTIRRPISVLIGLSSMKLSVRYELCPAETAASDQPEKRADSGVPMSSSLTLVSMVVLEK